MQVSAGQGLLCRVKVALPGADFHTYLRGNKSRTGSSCQLIFGCTVLKIKLHECDLRRCILKLRLGRREMRPVETTSALFLPR